MKRVDVPLRMVPNIIASCIVLHNLCIISKDKFDKTRIENAEKELIKRMENGGLKGGQELQGEQVSLAQVRSRIQNSDPRRSLKDGEVLIEEEIDEERDAFLIKETESVEILLREATRTHEVIAKSLWKYKLTVESRLQFYDSSDSDAIEE